MTDATRLHDGLAEYLEALERHLVVMREHGARLDAAWLAARDVFEGRAAEVFADAFGRADLMLKSYVTAAEAIMPIMRSRIEALERFVSPHDSPDDPAPDSPR